MTEEEFKMLKYLHNKAHEAGEINNDTWHLGTILISIWADVNTISQKLMSE